MIGVIGRIRAALLPSIDADPDGEMRRTVHAGMWVIGIGIFGLGGWAAFAPLSGAVIAQGFVKVDMNRKVVQHQEGGIVKEIKVRDGERVRQGQPLIVQEDVRVDATFELLQQQLESERARSARLQSERTLAPKVVFPKEIEERRGQARTAEVIERETALFRARRDALDSQIAVLRRQIAEAGDEIRALKDQIAAEERAMKLQKEELAVNEKLVRENFIQRTRIIALERAVAEYEGRHGEHRAELSKTHQRISELELRILSMRNTYIQGATDEQKDSTAKIFDLEERLRPSRDASQRQVVTAPIAGEVVGLKVFSSGAVVGPRETMLEVVPDEKTLIVEARIKPEDISHVHLGQDADVRLTTYKQRTTPLLPGKVTYVSGDRLVDAVSGAGAAPYYMVHIDVPASELTLSHLRMQAGMPAEIFLSTDKRTAMDYLIAPFMAYVRRGMREPL